MTFPALVGATAVGKTALSLRVAQELDAELISMDSRQIYRRMDVGTAKVDRESRALVPHHGLDLIEPSESYSAVRFAREARVWAHKIEGRGRLPIVVGGSGFFLRALMDPVFREPAVSEDRRSRLRRWLSGRPTEELARWVRALDPARALLAEAGGPHRLSRSVEVPLLTGRPLSWWHRKGPLEARPLDVRVVLVELPRGELYRRIDERTSRMFEGGLLEEVRRLLEEGYTVHDPGMTGTGYREAASVVLGELDLAEALDSVQKATRGYARRQLTWFRNQIPEPALRVDASISLVDQTEQVVRWWEGTRAHVRG